MTRIAGREITKNTMVGMSVGTLLTIIVLVWTASGIGRPLFAADLARIEDKIDSYQTGTAIQILNIRKSALQSDLREAKRDQRRNPDDDDAMDDVDDIEGDIADIDKKITCYRTVGCEVGGKQRSANP